MRPDGSTPVSGPRWVVAPLHSLPTCKAMVSSAPAGGPCGSVRAATRTGPQRPAAGVREQKVDIKVEPIRAIKEIECQIWQLPFDYGVPWWYVYGMATAKRSKESELSQVEAVLVDIVRLAAREEASSITRRIRRWVGSPAARRGGVSDGLRMEIIRALEVVADEPQRLRRSAVAEFVSPEMATTIDSGEPLSRRPVLAPQVHEALERLANEYERRDELAAHGLVPTRTLLLSGPPGVGKTMTAAWLADRLGLPLLSIEPSRVMTSLLGESARNLVGALAEAREVPSVVLLDEIDAFGKSRDDAQDVGELKRLVTTLLVELDRWPARNLLIGATNHAGLLDHALERRFEMRLALGFPGAQERAQIMADVLGEHAVTLNGALDALVALTEGRSGSDLRVLMQGGIRSAVLTETPIALTLLRNVLPSDPSGLSRAARSEFAHVANTSGGLSTRAIGDLLGCSHTAVGRMLNGPAGKAQR
jgi:SpoVK/Ycf46/Vps4 family AAA+-type ATPase